jgi:DNA-binding Xre family transcriptional regulator
VAVHSAELSETQAHSGFDLYIAIGESGIRADFVPGKRTIGVNVSNHETGVSAVGAAVFDRVARTNRLGDCRRIRKAAGMASRQHWYAIESGRKQNVTIETLYRIAKVLKVKPADLLK